MKRSSVAAALCATVLCLAFLPACGSEAATDEHSEDVEFAVVEDAPYESSSAAGEASGGSAAIGQSSQDVQNAGNANNQGGAALDGLDPEERESAYRAQQADRISIDEDFRESFVHGEKGSEYQKYIVLHDTEGESDPSSVVEFWDGNGNLVAAHFIVGMDGTICQCVPMDSIAHHAGYGDAGHNEEFGLVEDGRDDMLGTVPIGDWAPDYGMNAWSIGIEMVHVGGTGYYPEEQLEALDDLIAYIDGYYGFESEITDHKAWRSGNSDTSPEFEEYLANYQDHRTHD